MTISGTDNQADELLLRELRRNALELSEKLRKFGSEAKAQRIASNQRANRSEATALWEALIEASAALARLQSLALEVTDATNSPEGMRFQPSHIEITKALAVQIREFVPAQLHGIISHSFSSIYSIERLILLIVSERSIRDLLVRDFGCTVSEATEAEELVRDFLKAKGLNLEVSPSPAFEAAASGLPTKLPDAPPAYAYKPRMEGGIEKYLRDNWADHIKAGLLSRPDLKRIDPIAYKALHNWLSKPSNQLPADLVVPTKSERIDTQLENAAGLEDAMRLAAAKRARERRPRST